MYTREGHVSLAHLWRDFESRFLPLCRTRALASMEADPCASNSVFGTALDLCEDVFLSTFDQTHLSLVPLQGEIIQVEPVLAYSGARLLLKASVFESTQISTTPEEAGPGGEWLRQIGSSAFRAADLEWVWPDKKGRNVGADLEKALFANVFHTLPILFERPAFTIVQDLPPWSHDLLEEAYVRSIWPETRRASICLPDVSAETWKKSLTVKNVDKCLKELLLHFPADGDRESTARGGRPAKLADVEEAYRELSLDHEDLPRKEELRRIERYLGNAISESTLDRARRSSRTKRTTKRD